MNDDRSTVVEAHELRKRYGQGKDIRAALDGVTLDVATGDFVAVVGPSGCGKSTLLGILGGLDRTYEGTLSLFGVPTAGLSDRALADMRGRRIGFVFQAFHLLGHLSARDNILAPTLFFRGKLDGAKRRRWTERAEQLLGDVGLEGRGGDMPSQLSGGERQRVAIARSMLMEPELLLCDEPTGNLDQKTGAQIVEIFRRLHQSEGLTVVGVTHDELLTDAATRVVRMRRGTLVSEEAPPSSEAPEVA